jgi:predicted secreted protein
LFSIHHLALCGTYWHSFWDFFFFEHIRHYRQVANRERFWAYLTLPEASYIFWYITLFIKLSLSVRPKPYLHMVKLCTMTKAQQISAIQRHAQINHSLRSVVLSAAVESVGRQRPIRGRQPVSAQVSNWLAVVNRCQSLYSALLTCRPAECLMAGSTVELPFSGDQIFWSFYLLLSSALYVFTGLLQSDMSFTPALPRFWVGTFQNILGILYKKSQTNKVSKWEQVGAGAKRRRPLVIVRIKLKCWCSLEEGLPRANNLKMAVKAWLPL